MNKDKEPCKWEKALISLTPGGSEFCGDAEYCLKYIKDFQASQHKMIIDLVMEKKVLRKALDAAIN